MLQPARRKYRKEQKGRNRGIATRGNKVSFGEYGLKATTRGRLTARQIEAARRAMSRSIKRGGRIWIRSCKHIFSRRIGVAASVVRAVAVNICRACAEIIIGCRAQAAERDAVVGYQG